MSIYYKKKPVIIEAIQFTGAESVEKMLDAWGAKFQRHMNAHQDGVVLVLDTLEGAITAQLNDWVIKGIKGEFYPCKPDIFEATYEAVP